MSSRLFVKNLPKHATDASLRELFSSQGGQVTDAKVLKDPKTGESRRAGFVGFRSEEEAQHAVKYFDKTYMTTSKLNVTLAKPVGSEDLAMFKRRKEQEMKTKAVGSKGGVKRAAAAQDDKEEAEEVEEKEKEGDHRKRAKSSSTKAAVAPVVTDAKHEQFLKLMRPNRAVKGEDDDEEEEEDEDNENKAEPKAPQDEADKKPEPSAAASSSDRLFVRNLPYTCTKEELIQCFNDLPTEVVLPVDANQKPKGFAILRFPSASLAADMLTKFTARPHQFQGRLLHVLPAQPERHPAAEASGGADSSSFKTHGSSSYKDEREAERRKQAGSASDTKTWNGLFLRGDAAAGAMAASLGVSKRDLVLGGGDGEDDAAIRVAMSEARVIQDNKTFLAQQGVNLDALQQVVSSNNKQEPTTLLLAKNLPETASEAELKTMFAKIGTLNRFVMPPSRTLALIAFNDAPDAKRAMATLAYSRYKSSPLYLQYAPASLLRRRENDEPEEEEEDAAAQDDQSAAAAAAAVTASSSSMLFVKNLEWAVTEAALLKHVNGLSGCPHAVHVSIPKRAGKKAGEELSSGFGFCQFADAESAARALRKLHGSTLMGHTLDVHLSLPKTGSSGEHKAKKSATSTATKLVVRNLAFEATKKDVQKLFGAAAQVKSVRLPKKMDGTTRGFAFVEFTSHQQAKLAKQALESAHLYGRRLVAEFAENTHEEEDQLAEERRKMRGE